MATPFSSAPQPMDPNAGGQQGPGQDGSMPGMPPMQPAMNLDPTHAQQPQMGGDYDGDNDPQQEQIENLMDSAREDANLAKKYKDKKDKDGNEILEVMASELVAAISDDIMSRSAWMDANDEWLKLALLLRENKSWPWPKAANIKYPLVATAAMQFSARAYPALVPNDGQIVKARLSAVDMQGDLEKAAIRVGKFMSYQVLCDIPNWEENMDKLLMTMAISGICFKKTYHDAIDGCHHSDIVYPENLIINYYAKSMEKAYRKTEVLHYTSNEVKEKVLADEHFLDIEYSEPTSDTTNLQKMALATDIRPGKVDKATPHTFWACHTYWDLDDDGYEEPYIVTIHKQTGKVVRIIARWDSDGVQKNEKDDIIRIKPVEYFTDFPFVPNPDGSIYACGFGMLLGPINEAINTNINQLVDSGTLANLSGGFVGKNLRIKMGQLQLRPGEWKVVNAPGEDLSKSFYPVPTKEPSEVLFNLLNMLITSGKELASIAEIFVGKMPGQNTPATTTQETIQQGMAVFTAIYKRVYRSLQKEFKKIFRLNRITPDIIQQEMKIAGEPVQQSDFSGTEHLIIPGADPSGDAATVRQQKLQTVGQMISLGTINPMTYTQMTLEAMELPNSQSLLMQPQPQQDPKAQALQQKAQIDQQKAQTDQQSKQQELQIKQQLAMLEMEKKRMELEFKQQELQMDMEGQRQQHHLDMVMGVSEQQHKAQMAEMDMQVSAKKAESDIATNNAMNQQSLQHSEQQHEQKMTQAKQEQKMKPKETNGGKQKRVRSVAK
jgi:chaperonin GroES